MAVDRCCASRPLSRNAGLVVGTVVLISGAAMLGSLSSGDASNAAFLALPKTGDAAGRSSCRGAHVVAPATAAERACGIVSPSGSVIAVGMLCTAFVVAAKTAAARRQRGKQSSQHRGAKLVRFGGSVESTRVLGGWSLDVDHGIIDEELGGCKLEVIAEGVLQLSFLVPSDVTGSKEEYDLGKGTTENSYILYDPEDGLKGTAPMIIIDVPDRRFAKAFLRECGQYLSRVEALVITSLDEENAELVSILAKGHAQSAGTTKLKIYCADVAMQVLKACVQDQTFLDEVEFQEITDDSYIPCPSANPESASAGKRLDIVQTQTLKLPESMNVFDERTSMLFSGKFFCAHRVKEDGADWAEPSWSDWAEDWHHYFDCTFFTVVAQEAVRRIFQIAADNSTDGVGLNSAEVETLAPRHGPVIRRETWKLMAKYEAWLQRKLSAANDCSALILYASAYGNTFTMAKDVEEGLKEQGVKTTSLDLEFCTAQEVRDALELADGLAIGSPTLGGQMPIQVKEAMGVVLQYSQGGSKESAGSLSRKNLSRTKMPAGAFGSYGWSGEAVDDIYIRLKEAGFETGFDPIRCKFKPTDMVKNQCRVAGQELAQKMNSFKQAMARSLQQAEEEAGSKKLRDRVSEAEKKKDEGLSKAFSKIINASCMLTMKSADEGGECLRLPVSWVSQASFVPPGLMIAVHKQSLDPFLKQSPEEQVKQLYAKYDVDGSGSLDREEIDQLLNELLGAKAGSMSAEMLTAEKDEAWKLLDCDGSGEIDQTEFENAAASGPFADFIKQHQRLASLEALLSSDGGKRTEFSLSMLPEGMNWQEALKAQLVEKKAKNNCAVLKGCTAYVECRIENVMGVGDCAVLYASVTRGDMIDKKNNRTELLRADHVAIANTEGEDVHEVEAVDDTKKESKLMAAALGTARGLPPTVAAGVQAAGAEPALAGNSAPGLGRAAGRRGRGTAGSPSQHK